jgi:excisionase family DNA binding protein
MCYAAHMSGANPHANSQQLTLLVWESEVVKTGNNEVRIIARKPLSEMTSKQAAKCLRVTEWTIHKLWRAGKLQGYKPGAAKKRRDGRASNAKLVLDAESVLRHKEASRSA